MSYRVWGATGARKVTGRGYQAVPVEQSAKPEGKRGRRKEFTDAEVAEILRLRNEGCSARQIGERLGAGQARVEVVLVERGALR